jgi:hypothetical protein
MRVSVRGACGRRRGGSCGGEWGGRCMVFGVWWREAPGVYNAHVSVSLRGQQTSGFPSRMRVAQALSPSRHPVAVPVCTSKRSRLVFCREAVDAWRAFVLWRSRLGGLVSSILQKASLSLGLLNLLLLDPLVCRCLSVRLSQYAARIVYTVKPRKSLKVSKSNCWAPAAPFLRAAPPQTGCSQKCSVRVFLRRPPNGFGSRSAREHVRWALPARWLLFRRGFCLCYSSAFFLPILSYRIVSSAVPLPPFFFIVRVVTTRRAHLIYKRQEHCQHVLPECSSPDCVSLHGHGRRPCSQPRSFRIG